MGYVDTRMAAHAEGPTTLPTELVRAVYGAVEAGEYEVIANQMTSNVNAALNAPGQALYAEFAS